MAERFFIEEAPLNQSECLQDLMVYGLELLVNQALRDLGFSQDEVFRAIVYRPSDGQHHMVTFWFEERNDPWVIDPTGAMTAGMPRMSDLPEWRPLKVFSEQREFTVRAVRTDLRP